MVWTPTVYSLAAFGAAVVSLALSVVAHGREEAYARPFVWLMIVEGAWAGLYGIQLGFDTVGAQLVVFRPFAVLGAVVPTMWLWFAISYAGVTDRLGRLKWVLVVEPIAFLVGVVTNAQYGLLWTDPYISPSGGLPTFLFTVGDAYWLHILYAYGLVAVGISLIGWIAVTGPPVANRQSFLLIVGAFPPSVTTALATLQIPIVPGVDVTPFAHVGSGLVWGVALFRLDLLDRVPPARRHAVQGVGSGLVVTDAAGSVVEADTLSRKVFDKELSVGDTLRPAATDGAGSPLGLNGDQRTAIVDGHRRAFDTTVEPLLDHHDRTTGYAVVVHDVTERYAYEQRLEVANRVLRHNLSNEMNVVLGHANHLAESVDDPQLESAAESVHEAGRELLEISEKAREIVNLESHYGALESLSLTTPTQEVVDRFRGSTPAEIDLSVETDATVVVGSRQGYEIALTNLIENAVEHHDGEPTVWVRIERVSDEVVVTVADDGPGVPDTDRLAVERGSETPLKHTSGLGLWIAHWTATAVGGDLTLTDREPRGTQVELRLPIAES